MAVKFFKLTIKGQEYKLQNIKSFVETKIDNTDLHDTIGDGKINIYQEDEEFVLSLSMFIKPTKSLIKYVDYIKNINLDGINSIKIIKNENCTHDLDNPQPDIIEEVYSWP